MCMCPVLNVSIYMDAFSFETYQSEQRQQTKNKKKLKEPMTYGDASKSGCFFSFPFQRPEEKTINVLYLK